MLNHKHHNSLSLGEFFLKNCSCKISICKYTRDVMQLLTRVSLHIAPLVAAIFLWLWIWRKFSFHGILAIPFGYDPWLYKTMRIEYQSLWTQRDRSQLPIRIQSMYEPLLGMLWHLLGTRWIPYHDHIHIIGWSIATAVLPLSAYLLGSIFNKKIALLACILTFVSFPQHMLFWRGYWKQVWGILIMAVIIYLLHRKHIIACIPIIIASFLINRAAALFIGILWIVMMIRAYLIHSDKHHAVMYLLSGILSLLITAVVLGPLIPYQYLTLLPGFLKSFDIAAITLYDGYQSGGSFMTTREYLSSSRMIIILGVLGLYRGYRNQQIWALWLITVIILLRVGGQFFFYQRIMGYLDLLLIIRAAYRLITSATPCQKRCLPLMISIIWYCGISLIHPQSQRLITPIEFTYIASFQQKLDPTGTVIVPGIWYSPRVRGRYRGRVIAPGLFDLNRRGNQWADRSTKRYNQSAADKCRHIATDFPDILDAPIYIFHGSKQEQDIYNWHCIKLVYSHPQWLFSLYQMHYE